MAKLRPYVLTITEGKKNSNMLINLYGPLSNINDAAKWGKCWQEANGDEPRWNVVMLSKKRIGVNTLLVPVIKAYFGG